MKIGMKFKASGENTITVYFAVEIGALSAEMQA
jgi:hypothetical protein